VKEIDSYLVRIVRRDGNTLAGVVEQVRTGKTAAFATLAELTGLLGGQRRFMRFRSPVTNDASAAQPHKRANKP
jgi:CO dehydrogenase/acetyl-CoA synthase delta subunit